MLAKDRFNFSSPNAIDAGEMPPSAPTRSIRSGVSTTLDAEDEAFIPSTPSTPERRIINTSMNFGDARDNAQSFLKDIEVSPTRGTEQFRDEEDPLMDVSQEYGDYGDEKLSDSSTSTYHSEQSGFRGSRPTQSSGLGWHRPSRRGRKLALPSLRRKEDQMSRHTNIREGHMSEPEPAYSKPLVLFFCLAPLALIVLVSFSISHVFGQDGRVAQGRDDGTTYVSERFFQTLEMLKMHGVSDETVLSVMGTPQNKAALWMADVDPLQYEIPSPDMTLEESYQFIQRYVLVLLYHATGGNESWHNTLDFLSGNHECSWYHSKKFTDGDVYAMGVTCRGSDLQVSDLLIRK